jgi:DNA polymerase I-like protein with 3'-5' exonuclease and polymerase domains
MALFGGITLPGHPDLENIRKLDLLPVRSIMEMMERGIAIDIPHLKEVSLTLAKEMKELREEICGWIPEEKLDEFIDRSNIDEDSEDGYLPMNVDSNQQLAELLFKCLGVGKDRQLKRTKSGDQVSTGRRQLEQLRLEHPVVQHVLAYRERAKLKNTYADRLPELAVYDPLTDTWRVHTQILSTRTDTGRYACVAPWTEVETLRGKIPMRDVRVGDFVLTHRLRWRRVTAVWVKGYEGMYDITFSTGKVLTCTGNHKLLVYSNEYIEKMAEERGEYKVGTGNVPKSGTTDHRSDSGSSKNDLPKHPMGSQEQDAESGIQGFNEVPLFAFKDCREESDVWKIQGETPQLDRIRGRWARVSDLPCRWEAPVCPSLSDGGISRARVPARVHGCPPYRRQYEEQQDRQPSSGDKGGASYPSLHAGQGQSFCLIKEIKPAGSFTVYDISVEDDESYLACGVFSHNSKNPNLQNIPIRSLHGQNIRRAFISSPGMRFVSVDFSQIELRVLAFLGNVKRMIQVFREDRDIHNETAMEAFGITEAEVNADKIRYRNPSKNVGFAIIFRETALGLYEQLVSDNYGKAGIPVPSWLTLEWCESFLRKWFKLYPEVVTYMEQQDYRACRYGMVWDLCGRIRRIPEVRSVHPRIMAAGLRQAGNMPIQGLAAELMKLAIAETQLWIETDLRPAGIRCWPLMTIHDELLLEVQEEYGETVKEVVEGVFANVLTDKDTGEELCMVPIKAEGKVMERWEK